MAKPPLYSLDDIIAAGEQMEASATGGSVQAWEVFQALGGRGKYDRVRDIWEGHVAARSSSPVSQAPDLPAEVDAAIVRSLDTVGESIRKLFMVHFAGLAADHVRHLQLAHKQRADELASQGRELEFWRAKATAEDEPHEVPEAEKPVTKRRGRTNPASGTAAGKSALAPAKQKPKATPKTKPKATAAVEAGPVGDTDTREKYYDDPNQQQLPL